MNTISSITLSKTYGSDAKYVLSAYLRALPKTSRRGPTTYEIVQPLPAVEAYKAVRDARHSSSVEDLVESAKGEIETLAEEMNNWADNMPEGLQGGDKYSEIQDAASTLEGISIEDIPERFLQIRAVMHPNYDKESRSDRSAEASAQLRAAADAIEAQIEVDKAANDAKEKAGETVEPIDEDEYHSVAANLNEAADELDNLSFPGMY